LLVISRYGVHQAIKGNGRRARFGKVIMPEKIRITLGHPVLIFVYSLALLLIGCAIGMHWYQSRASAIWIAVAAASMMVVHDMLTGLIWASVTLRSLRRQRRHEVQE
jgi:hypothetical protein